MNAIDIVLLLLALAYAVAGLTQGLIVGVSSFVGFVGGALLGLWLAPQVLTGFRPGLGTAILALILVLVLATIGQGVTAWMGTAIRSKLPWRSFRAVDAVGGGLFSIAALLVAAWVIGLAAASSSIPTVSSAARESRVLATVDEYMPRAPREVVAQFRDLVGSGAFPSIVLPFEPEPIAGVEAPENGSARTPGVRAASASVVKVLGEARACERVYEGSAFPVSADRLMTNAHVVAGTTRVVVLTPDQRRLDATVVRFDPQTDLALLQVPKHGLRPLGFAPQPATPAQRAAVLGYPNNGPFAAESVRVRSRRTLVGEDIYGQQRVSREVVAVRGSVQPGNSGGPLVDEAGRVLGVIFAASLTDSETGYALAPVEVAPALAQPADQVTPVSTGTCQR